jgi:hypothetical protein
LAHTVIRKTSHSTTSKSNSQAAHRKRKLGHEASRLGMAWCRENPTIRMAAM